ncbi:MAG TPA: hypothetical protein PKW71_05460, partial [Anaerohalosphaeraceae bacterium]|nr:hypothetical protein [Anaerohalosphaeraceae bacterium]
MSCCGKTIRKVIHIAKGTMADMLGIKYEFTDGRVRTCRNCENRTWLSASEYWEWVADHGGRMKFMAELDDLSS